MRSKSCSRRDREKALEICIVERELSGLLALAGLPELLAVETVAGTILGWRPVAWREFLRQRSGGGPAKAGYGFRIRFHGDGGRAGGFGRGEPLRDGD